MEADADVVSKNSVMIVDILNMKREHKRQNMECQSLS